jgi:D-alanyl-D-alanine dipeptidase
MSRHPRSLVINRKKTWMAGTSLAMTIEGSTLVKTIVVTLAIIACSVPAHAQTLPGGFVFLRDVDPTIIQDIRYAGSNNFIGRPLRGYEAAECVVKRDVGLALKSIQQALAPQKLSLKMLLPPGARGARHGGVGAERPGDAARAAV